jgi:sporulation protein YlmC with PRC-barrel domain
MEYYPDFPEEEEEGGLVRLSRVAYQLADGQPDAMGWRVLDNDGVEFGRISDLLADVGTGQIIFAAVTSHASGKTALIPVEGMYLDLAMGAVVVPVSEAAVRGCPEFTDDVVDVMPYVEYWLRQVAA